MKLLIQVPFVRLLLVALSHGAALIHRTPQSATGAASAVTKGRPVILTRQNIYHDVLRPSSELAKGAPVAGEGIQKEETATSSASYANVAASTLSRVSAFKWRMVP
jgi:hypothetical protein